jgi:hypothetical protein
MEAFNPLIPGDADLSRIPVAVLRFALTNESDPRSVQRPKTQSVQRSRVRSSLCESDGQLGGHSGFNRLSLFGSNRAR